MVHFLQCSSNAHMMSPLFFFFSFLLLLVSMEVTHSDARKLPPRMLGLGASSKEDEDDSRAEMVKMEGRGLIGSRPPRCDRVCSSCGHCEAVQIPMVPQDHHHRRPRRSPSSTQEEHHHGAAMVTTSWSVDGGLSNYKPLSWKCKCGGIILDP